MNEPHIIRLRGPWQRKILTGDSSEATAGDESLTVKMPSSWVDDLGANFVGVVCYSRMFNRPTGIDETTDIRVRLRRVVGKATTVRLNGEVVGDILWPKDSGEVDVTGQLKPRNCLEVEITSLLEEACKSKTESKLDATHQDDPGLVDEVHLEIG